MTGAHMFQWHFAKVDEYGLGGWWFWTYRDTATDPTGIRDVHGRWKDDLVNAIRQRAVPSTASQRRTTSHLPPKPLP
jgi:hypothetical protein